MSCCLPTCAVPSCSSTPVFPLGSSGCGGSSYGGALGVSGLSGLNGRSTTTAELGTLAGVNPQPISQLQTSEVLIHPSPVAVIMPGAIMASTCEPVLVGGSTYPGLGSSSSGRLGSHRQGGYLGRNICSLPC